MIISTFMDYFPTLRTVIGGVLTGRWNCGEDCRRPDGSEEVDDLAVRLNESSITRPQVLA